MKCSNPKEYWKIINKDDSTPKRVGDITMEAFVNHFRKLNNDQSISEHTSNHSNTFDPRNITQSLNEEINRNFSSEEIITLIKRLKNNKANGIDNIINEFLKNCPDCVIYIIVQLFNLVLNTGIVPTDWCIGIVVPLYKNKGSIDDPDNYRGITLLSCLGKLFTAAINARLTSYLENTGTALTTPQWIMCLCSMA